MALTPKTKIKLLKFCFWLGAVTDGLAVLPMIFPGIGAALFGGDAVKLGMEYRYAMGFGASLMAGWTVLLLWGARKPLERRGLLLITVFPVIAGIVATTVYGVAGGLMVAAKVIPLWIHLGLICALYLSAYVISGAAGFGSDGRRHSLGGATGDHLEETRR